MAQKTITGKGNMIDTLRLNRLGFSYYHEQSNPAVSHPDASIVGGISPEDGHEYLEYPAGSGVWYIRNQTTNQWEKWA